MVAGMTIDWTRVSILVLSVICVVCLIGLIDQRKQIVALNSAFFFYSQSNVDQNSISKQEFAAALERQETINIMLGEFLSELAKRHELEQKQRVPRPIQSASRAR